MDHNMEIGVTPAQVNQNGQANLTSLQIKKDNKGQESKRKRARDGEDINRREGLAEQGREIRGRNSRRRWRAAMVEGG